MSFESFRWRVGAKTRQIMLSSSERGLLHGAYNVLRKFPGVRRLWRFLLRNSDDWRNLKLYEAQGGTFATPMQEILGYTREYAFGTQAYFEELIDRVEKYERKLTHYDGPIAIVNNGLSSGGAERQIIYTLLGLQAEREPVFFIGQYLDRAPSLGFHLPELRENGIAYLSLPTQTSPGSNLYSDVTKPVAELLSLMPADMLLEILDMVKLLREKNPRVIHLWQDDTSTKHSISALISGVPKIVTSGRNVNPTHFSFFLPHMHAAYQAIMGLKQVTLSNNSYAGARSYSEWLDISSNQISVIYNGFDTSRWPPVSVSRQHEFRTENDIPLTAPIVSGVFRLAPEKRPLLWLEAAAFMLENEPDTRFILAGVGPMYELARQHAQMLGLSENLIMLGESQDVGTLLATSDLFLMTSIQEGTPNSLIEAQWHGTLGITTNAGGAGEAIIDGKTGVLLSVDATSEEIGKTLLKTWRDKTLREEAALTGPEFISQRFGLKRMVQETQKVYQSH